MVNAFCVGGGGYGSGNGHGCGIVRSGVGTGLLGLFSHGVGGHCWVLGVLVWAGGMISNGSYVGNAGSRLEMCIQF